MILFCASYHAVWCNHSLQSKSPGEEADFASGVVNARFRDLQARHWTGVLPSSRLSMSAAWPSLGCRTSPAPLQFSCREPQLWFHLSKAPLWTLLNRQCVDLCIRYVDLCIKCQRAELRVLFMMISRSQNSTVLGLIFLGHLREIESSLR